MHYGFITSTGLLIATDTIEDAKKKRALVESHNKVKCSDIFSHESIIELHDILTKGIK